MHAIAQTRAITWSASKRVATFVALSCVFVARPGWAQEDEPTPAPVQSAPPAPAVQPRPAQAEPQATAAQGIFSLALERFGGLAYTNASNGPASASVFTFGLGVASSDVSTVPRVGFDYVFSSRVSLGAGAGIMHLSSSGGATGEIFIFTVTPRLGYRISLSKHVDLTPRVGTTIAGASVSGRSASGVSYGAGVDAPFAFRVTDSFNVLLAPDFSLRVNDSASTTFLTLQAWVGVGGYI